MTTIPPDTVAPGQSGHVDAHNEISDALTAHDQQLQGIPAMHSGKSSLASGTVAVSLSAVTASSVILVSRMTPSGALGHLSVPSVTPGSGFTILSSSSSEASLVAWQVLG